MSATKEELIIQLAECHELLKEMIASLRPVPGGLAKAARDLLDTHNVEYTDLLHEWAQVDRETK